MNWRWFADLRKCPGYIITIKGKKLKSKHLYGRIKKNNSNQVAASVIVSLGKDDKGNEILAKIIFIRDDRDRGKWIALLSTNTSLADEEIIRIYGKRWDIEVFFKMNKSYLKLAKEFQGRSYDMMFAHTTIVFTRYILLTLEARKTRDSRTFGGMFFEFCDEMEDLKFIEALFLLIDLFRQALNDCLKISQHKINQLLDYFFELLPGYIKEPLMILNSES